MDQCIDIQEVKKVIFSQEGRWFDLDSSGLHGEMSSSEILNFNMLPAAVSLVCECESFSWWGGEDFVGTPPAISV